MLWSFLAANKQNICGQMSEINDMMAAENEKKEDWFFLKIICATVFKKETKLCDVNSLTVSTYICFVHPSGKKCQLIYVIPERWRRQHCQVASGVDHQLRQFLSRISTKFVP